METKQLVIKRGNITKKYDIIFSYKYNDIEYLIYTNNKLDDKNNIIIYYGKMINNKIEEVEDSERKYMDNILEELYKKI